MQSSISSQKTPKYKKWAKKKNSLKSFEPSCFMMKCRWWDSNPHGFPNDFESFASAIPPHRLIFNFGTFVPVSEDWRDVQEGCRAKRSSASAQNERKVKDDEQISSEKILQENVCKLSRCSYRGRCNKSLGLQKPDRCDTAHPSEPDPIPEGRQKFYDSKRISHRLSFG